MSFGLSNTLTSFQDYNNKALTKKLDIFVIFYLDNLLIYIDKVNHVNSIWWVFK